LFWVTLALIAVALGSLGLYEYAGGAVVEAAYPALALTVVGAMLVLGAWVGRPGGLILLGVLAAIALAVTSTIGPRFEGGAQRVDVSPVEAAEVKDTYYVPAGEIHVDLSAVDDIAGLDGRRIDLEANAGEIVVTVPDGMDVEVTADVTVGGEAFVLGQGESGPDVHLVNEITAGPGAPDLEIDARLLVGSIRVQSSEG